MNYSDNSVSCYVVTGFDADDSRVMISINQKKFDYLGRQIQMALALNTLALISSSSSTSLFKKTTEVRPPQTREDLYDIIMAKKKGRLGKLKLTGKMFVDAVRTGQTNLLKS